MHKINAPHATAGGEFTDGDPAMGIEATELMASWHNAIQRELIAVLTAAGITPSAANDGQVAQAIIALLAEHTGLSTAHGATPLAAALKMVVRDSFKRAKFGAGVAADDAVIYQQLVEATSGYNIASKIMPAWWAGWGVGNYFTPTQNGWIKIGYSENAFSGQYYVLWVGGVLMSKFAQNGGGAGHARQIDGLIPVRAGSQVVYETNASFWMNFYPCAGEV